MGKGARFDHSFLLQQTEKRKNWRSKGKKAGHGGDFNIYSPLSELNATTAFVRSPKQVQTKLYIPWLVDSCDLPSWMISILERDHELQHFVANKKSTIESPHKKRLVQGIKNPSLLTDTRLAEHWLQVRLFYTLERSFRYVYPLTFAIPNGGYRTPKSAAMMKYEGQKSGVPDIFIPMPKGKYHGLFLEVKIDTGKPSKEQIRKIDLFKEQGYCVEVGKGFSNCVELIASYLRLPTFDNKTTMQQNRARTG